MLRLNQALQEYKKSTLALPRPWCSEDADKFLEVFKSVNEASTIKCEDFNEALVRDFAHTCAGEIVAVDAVVGGIVAQEVMKACSGKFSPLFQWLYFDAFECLPEDR